MEHQILDAEESIIKKQPPVSTWKTGFLLGSISAALLAIGNSGIFDFQVPYLLPMLLFGWIAQMRIAALGKRKNHFMQIWAVTLVVVVLVLTVELIKPLAKSWNDIDAYTIAGIIGMTLGHWLFFGITALIFWFFPGKLAYFRNRVAE